MSADLNAAGPRAVVMTFETSSDLMLGGSPLFTGTPDDLLDRLSAAMKSGRPELVVTPNVDHAINLAHNADYARLYHRAALRLIDGVPLLWLARLLGARDTIKISGSDLIGLCAAVALERGWRVALVGGDADMAERANERMCSVYQHEHATFTILPVPLLDGPADVAARDTVAALDKLRPHLTFICLGSPKQELWFEFWEPELPPGVYVGAGATIDFVAGTKTRAPRLLQIVGLEWLWRLALEPRRLWRRYLVKGPRFIPIAVRSLRERYLP